MALNTPSGGAMVQNDPTKIKEQINTLQGYVNKAQGFGYAPNEQIQGLTGTAQNVTGTVLPKVSTTTIGNGHAMEQVPIIKNTYEQNTVKGLYSNANGTFYANGTRYQPPGTFGYDAQGNPLRDPNAPAGSFPGETGYDNKTTGTTNTGTYTDYNGYQVPASPEIPEGSRPDNQGGYITPEGIRIKAPTTDTSYQEYQTQQNNEKIKQITDAAMADAIDLIQRNYDRLIQQQKEINASQEAGVSTSLLRGGTAQFTSATNTQTLNSQIQYGQKQILDLENKEQEAILKAKLADYSTVAGVKALRDANDQIETIRKEKMALATKINEKIQDQIVKDAEAKKQADQDNAIAEIYSQGITDPTTIMNQLKKQGITITAKEVADAIKNITPPGLDDLIKNMRSNNAPQDLIQKVLGSTDINQAYETAGNYGAGGTGIIAEYNYAKANGYTGTFSDYQNEDANRKRLANQTVDTSGMTTKQQTTFLGITNKFQADTIMATANQAKTAIQIADQAIKNPKNAGDQLTILYTLVKNLDPNSAVREGELSLAQTTQSYLSKFQTNLQRITEGKVLSAQATKELAEATKSLAQKWQEAGLRREKQYKAQSQIAGVGDAFNEYLNTIERPYDTANDIVQTEKELVDKISEAIKNPETKKAYDTFKQLAPDATASEIAKHLGITQ